jgi:hypothetical protein
MVPLRDREVRTRGARGAGQPVLIHSGISRLIGAISRKPAPARCVTCQGEGFVFTDDECGEDDDGRTYRESFADPCPTCSGEPALLCDHCMERPARYRTPFATRENWCHSCWRPVERFVAGGFHPAHRTLGLPITVPFAILSTMARLFDAWFDGDAELRDDWLHTPLPVLLGGETPYLALAHGRMLALGCHISAVSADDELLRAVIGSAVCSNARPLTRLARDWRRLLREADRCLTAAEPGSQFETTYRDLRRDFDTLVAFVDGVRERRGSPDELLGLIEGMLVAHPQRIAWQEAAQRARVAVSLR